MADDRDSWGAMNPNSRHQLWSRWKFVFTAVRRPPVVEVRDNARRFFKQLFRTDVGQIRVSWAVGGTWTIELRLEGPPAHDPDCRASAQHQFVEHFMKRGFGPYSELVSMDVAILAGDEQDGKPSSQLIVLPPIALPPAMAAKIH